VNTTISPEQQAILAEIDAAEQQLSTQRDELRVVDEQLLEFEDERKKYQLLDEICGSLDKLAELKAEALFWGEGETAAVAEPQNLLARVRGSIEEFRQQISSFDESKTKLLRTIDRTESQLAYLQEDLLRQQESEDRAKYDYTITREAREFPYRPMVMPWTKQGEDEKRFRKTLLIVLLLTISFGGLIPFWELPKPDKDEPVEIPEHLVKLIKKEQPKPKPQPKKQEKKDEEKPKDKKPTEQQKQQARKKAETSGILAFKDNFTDLLDDDVTANLGSAANLSNTGAKAASDNSRDVVMAMSNSGGINTASLSKSVGGGAGQRIGSGVSFSRVESSIGTDGADERPLSDGPGPSRTDEEIQIVFDRYKSALYRIYNRELRKNPTLRGKMVLRITIQPDGSVSMVKVMSSEMDSAELDKNIVDRVKKFNFGAKEGVPAITIDYPIDFLPAS